MDFLQALEVLGLEPEVLAVTLKHDFQRGRAAEFLIDDGHALVNFGAFAEVIDETVFDFYERGSVGAECEERDGEKVDKPAMAL